MRIPQTKLHLYRRFASLPRGILMHVLGHPAPIVCCRAVFSICSSSRVAWTPLQTFSWLSRVSALFRGLPQPFLQRYWPASHGVLRLRCCCIAALVPMKLHLSHLSRSSTMLFTVHTTKLIFLYAFSGRMLLFTRLYCQKLVARFCLDCCSHFQVGGSFQSLLIVKNPMTHYIPCCSVPPSCGWAPSWQTSGSNSQRAPFQTLRLLRGPDWPGDPLALLQLKATWWPELVEFISFALQMLIKPLWVWAWRKETSKLFADKRIQRGCGSPNWETSCRILVFCAVDLIHMIPDKTDCLILRQSVHMFLRPQEYPKIWITTVKAHLLAGRHNLSSSKPVRRLRAICQEYYCKRNEAYILPPKLSIWP